MNKTAVAAKIVARGIARGSQVDVAGVLRRVEAPRFWIQEQAPAGNFFDSIGLDPRTTEAQARKQAKSWKSSFPARSVRLVVRTDVVIA